MSKILFPVQADYIRKFRKETDPLIFEMEEYAGKNSVPILSREAADFMEQLIQVAQPRRVLEIGTAIAYSSIRIARNLKKKGVVHTIEKSEESVVIANEYINRAGFEGKIKVITGNALDVIPRLEKKYDFIFLDADKGDYKKLFEYSLVLLKRNGVMFVDNLLWHGYAAAKKVPSDYRNSAKNIREFNELFMNHQALKTSLIPIGDGIGLGIKL